MNKNDVGEMCNLMAVHSKTEMIIGSIILHYEYTIPTEWRNFSFRSKNKNWHQ